MAYQPASASDLMFLVRSTLMADSTVSSIVGARVFGAHLQDPDAGSVDFPIVVIDLVGGLAALSSGYQLANVDVWAYSRQSAGQALRLYDACFAALHHQLLRRDGVQFAGYAQENLRPNQEWNEKTRAYYAHGQFAVRGSYREAS